MIKNNPVKKIVILGGGSAGWLCAGMLASEFSPEKIHITVIESKDIPIIGVGEGTWPSMRQTLQKIGIDEIHFLQQCQATFKQGSKFIGWQKGGDEHYHHPFSLPENYTQQNIINAYARLHSLSDFAYDVSPQPLLSEHFFAPKQAATPAYAGNLNYGYHLDAHKFSVLLKEHCVNTLNVKHIETNISEIVCDENEFITHLMAQDNTKIEGDFFIDASGSRGVILQQHFGVERTNLEHILFNNTAIAVQIPTEEENIPCFTASTAFDYGWIWDIPLTHRHGIGCVFSDKYCSEEVAHKALEDYIKHASNKTDAQWHTQDSHFRTLKFSPGYLKHFWKNNCVAVGMAAGFIEPLEASALVLVETAAKMLIEQFPYERSMMPYLAKSYNQKFTRHWEQVIEFLKLHYVLSERRDSAYWQANTAEETLPETLKEKLALWRLQPPWRYDMTHIDNLFPSASYQYVLAGMGFEFTLPDDARKTAQFELEQAKQTFQQVKIKQEQFAAGLKNQRQTLAAMFNKIR